jgi:hypothetical protein
MDKPSWSYSSLKTFEQCPKKYYHIKVAKDIPYEDTEATRYGKEFHKAAEDFMRDGTPIPDKFKFAQDTLTALASIPGEKYCEIELGVKKTELGYEPCLFDDEEYWWHGIADLLVINGDKAFLLDYKTSKNAKYADVKQLDILAAAVFVHFPEVKRIKSALVFVVSGEFVKKDHEAAWCDAYFNLFTPELDRLAGAFESGVWNAVTSPLCKFCPVKQCEHNRGK